MLTFFRLSLVFTNIATTREPPSNGALGNIFYILVAKAKMLLKVVAKGIP